MWLVMKLAKKYSINCKLCNQTHYPIFDSKGMGAAGISAVDIVHSESETIIVPYKCPIMNKDAEVMFPYDDEIYGKGIVGWKEQNG